MSTQPSDLGITPQALSFTPPKRAFVLHNAKEREVDVMFNGNLMTVPGRNAVSVHRPARDADGDIIPGTLVVEDVYYYSPELGDDVLILDAGRAVAHILGISRGLGGAQAASSRFALGGLSLLPMGCSKEVWRSVLADGEKRAFMVEVDNARNVIAAHDAVNAKRRAGGGDPVPGGLSYDRARFVLQEYEKIYQREAQSHVASQRVAQDAESMEIADDLEFAAYAHAKVMEIATRVGEQKSVDKVALAKELLNDPEVRLKLQKEFRIRRKGYAPQQEEQLRAAAAAGLTVSDLEPPDVKE